MSKLKEEDSLDFTETPADDDASSSSGYGLGSCQICKNRKVRCDKQKPSCGRCIQRGLECTYRYKQKPGLKAGYGKELNDRMDFLEEQTLQNNQMLRTITETLTLLTQRMSGSPASSTGGTSSSTARIPPLSSSVGGAGSSNNGGGPAYNGSGNNGPGTGNVTFSEDMSTPGSPPTIYDTSLTSELVDLYFERIHPFFPILHETNTKKMLKQAIATSNNGLTANNPPLLLYSVIAITLRFMPDTRMSQHEKRILYNYCKETVILHSFEIKETSTLQALAVLAMDLVGISNGPQTWSILPLICSAAVHLGLAKEPEEVPHTEFSAVKVKPEPPSATDANPGNSHGHIHEHSQAYHRGVGAGMNSNMQSPHKNAHHEPQNAQEPENEPDNENDENENDSGEGEAESQWLTAASASILPNTRSWRENEARRRLFWGIYILDRILSVSTAFSFKLSSLEIHRRLPMKESLWLSEQQQQNTIPPITRWFKSPNLTNADISGPHSNLDEFGYMIENLQILSSIHEFLKTPVSIYSLSDVVAWQVKYRQLDIELDNWFRSLPESISNIQKDLFYKEINPMLIMLHSVYLTSVIRLNSSAGYSRLRSEYFTVSPSAARKCLVASSGVADLARHAILFGTWQKLGPHFAWTIWVSARLLIVDCVTNRKPLPNDLESLLTLLDNMGKYWVVAARYHKMLTMVLDEQLALRTRNEEGEEDKKRRSSKAEILSDMNRNAYALDFILSGKTHLKKRKLNHSKSGSTTGDSNKTTSPLASQVLNSDHMHTNTSTNTNANTAEASRGNVNNVNNLHNARNVGNTGYVENGGVLPTVLSQSNDMTNTDIFDWFNWPKRSYDSKEPGYPIHEHSVDDYKTILSRDEFVDVYGMKSTEGDWLNQQSQSQSQNPKGDNDPNPQ